ncbi:H+/gluconate symporter-like permease [Paraburkholderia sp. BL27I4N3]|uniref:GntP family permease n=1 Tax=Paraburkholderia sp. BL27I4N3 TaxID=1938805 RepID=UPI000E26F20D|nr:GntP family permease [Paraburkholderia sp. BL27I4N3]REE18376.1 H+/gluconate symporter-like permease [Paraburkholderia sp. BL27I4N3]
MNAVALTPLALGLGLAGMLVSLGLLIFFAYRGWSVLLLAPFAAMLAAGISGEPVLAHWTQTFMNSGARFLAQFFPLFLLGALFGKLMEDSGSVQAIAGFMNRRLGARRAILAVVIGGALVTYGGVSLFVAFFVLAPMAQALFLEGNIPRRLMPATIALGTSTFTMSALPGTPAIQNAIPMPFFGTTPFAAPGLGVIASLVMAGFGLWWLGRQEARARALGEGFTTDKAEPAIAELGASHDQELVRERATVSQSFDPVEIGHGHVSPILPSIGIAIAPLALVVGVNFLMNVVVLPRLDASYLAEARWGATSLAAVGGVWGVCVALGVAIVALVLLNRARLPALRESVDAGANAAVLPVLSVGSLVGYGAVIAALPAFALVREWVLGIGGGPLVSLAVATNLLAALTGSASGGMTIALDALGRTYLELAAQHHIDPALLHRVAVISSGTLDSLPHNGAVVTLLAVCGSTHRESYRDIVMVGIVGALLALIVVIAIGSAVGSF